MNERTSRKIPVTERQFLWVQDDDKGEVTLHVGPTMVSPTAADRVVVDDGLGGFREDSTGRPQSMVEVGDNQYAVLFNPLQENDGGPNGKFRPGRNESRPLQNGTRAMIPGPCYFWLRPGQRVEVRDAHELASDQYLVAKVYGPVDRSAPGYEITARSAAITQATAENVREDAGLSTRIDQLPLVEMRAGQLIVIRGVDTQLFIPPTGVDVVPDTSVDGSGAGIGAADAQRLLSELQRMEETAPVAEPVPPAEIESEAFAAREELDEVDRHPGARQAPRRLPAGEGVVDQSARTRQRKTAGAAPPAPSPALLATGFGFAHPDVPLPPPPAPPPSLVPVGDILSSPAVRRALERQVRQARLVRKAVVLGEKEYCVIVDADGKREIKVGPARVFPGPYDQFMVRGSRQRIYDAYELLPQRALWLRIIAPVSREELAERLPRGVPLEQDEYLPGDELLLTGVSAFFFPFNEIEVLSPETGEAVVGNDHTRVFIEAIGIDQKSGIYVRDLATGEVRLVRGKQSYLVDPRKEVQITRTVPAEEWNLWIGANEPHKLTDRPVTTPWALSIIVPHNTAVLATSADGQRVIEGPGVTLLHYEERLTPVNLSTGTPKSDDAPLRTCFLRTAGNRVSDVISLETSDFVVVSIKVSYSVTFVKEHRERWFNHDNYIQVMCEHLRSLVRGRARTLSLTQLWPQLPAFVRDLILGSRAADGSGRPGRLFPENGAIVTEVELLTSTIEDRAIAELMQRVQTQSVTLQIGDRQAQEALLSATLRSEVERQQQELLLLARRREAELREVTRTLEQQSALALARDEERLLQERQQLADEREQAAQQARLARAAADRQATLDRIREQAAAEAEAKRLVQTADLEAKQRLHELALARIQASAAATVAERQAVQRGLIEALTGLGDKLLLTECASNMNLVSLFKGKQVGAILAEVLGGTKLAPTLRALAGEPDAALTADVDSSMDGDEDEDEDEDEI